LDARRREPGSAAHRNDHQPSVGGKYRLNVNQREFTRTMNPSGDGKMWQQPMHGGLLAIKPPVLPVANRLLLYFLQRFSAPSSGKRTRSCRPLSVADPPGPSPALTRP